MNGFDNEFEFVKRINNRTIKQLNILLQDLIINLFGKVNDKAIIKAWRNHYKQKTDVLIKINSTIKRISIKMGSRNSVHVEGINTFTKFLFDSGIPEKIVNNYLKFHFGDGTINGTGKNRLSAQEIKEMFQTEIDEINKYFNNSNFSKTITERFITKGLVYHDHVDALIVGKVDDFLVLYEKDIFNIIKSNFGYHCSSPHFGPLVCQPLNRCINRNSKYEYARYYVQIKWYSLFDNMIEFMNEKVVNDIKSPS